MWYVALENGQTFGPLPRPQLDGWLAEGRVTRACRLQRVGGPWLPAELVFPRLAIPPEELEGYPPGYAVPVQPTRESQLTAEDCNEYGVHYLEQGDWRSAIRSLTSAVKADSGYAMAWHNRGYAHQLGGMRKEALADFTRAIQLDPHNDSLYEPRGLLLAEDGEHDKAVADLNRAVTADPGNAELYVARGGAHRLSGRTAQAINDLKQAVTLAPDNPDAHFHLGAAWFDADKQASLRHFHTAAELGRRDAACLFGRGATLFELGEHERASKDLQAALVQQPDHIAAHYYYGKALVKLWEGERAVAHLTRAAQASWKRQTEALLERGALLAALKRYHEALDDFSRALARLPGEIEPLWLRGQALAALGRSEESRQDLQEARRRISERIKSMQASGRRVTAAIVPASTELHEQGLRDGCLRALFSFEKTLRHNELFLYSLAAKAREMAGRGTSSQQQRLAMAISDPVHVPGRRLQLPPEFTGGPAVLLVDLPIRRQSLKDAKLSTPSLQCLVEPAENGRLEVVPHWTKFK